MINLRLALLAAQVDLALHANYVLLMLSRQNDSINFRKQPEVSSPKLMSTGHLSGADRYPSKKRGQQLADRELSGNWTASYRYPLGARPFDVWMH